MESVSVLLIQKTKNTAEDSLLTLKNLWPKGEGLAINASGASGGLLSWWDSEKFAMQTTIQNKNWSFVKLENKENKEVF